MSDTKITDKQKKKILGLYPEIEKDFNRGRKVWKSIPIELKLKADFEDFQIVHEFDKPVFMNKFTIMMEPDSSVFITNICLDGKSMEKEVVEWPIAAQIFHPEVMHDFIDREVKKIFIEGTNKSGKDGRLVCFLCWEE